MTDNGLAALAAALDETNTFRILDARGAEAAAAAILGERGVFLPDGLTDDRIGLLANMNRLAEANADYGAEIDRQAATIATLRAVEKAARKRAETGHDSTCRALMPSAGRPHRCDCGQSGLDTALATAKEKP
jgi:hypothetical protein